jgi:hypothetical protein
MAKKIPLNGWTKEKRWVQRKREWRRQRVVVDYAIVSDEDYDLVKDRSWYKTSHGYVQSDYPTRITMHKLITGYKMTDHINHNKIDNTRENLREVNSQQNNCNVRPKGKIEYKGVSYCKQTGRYRACKIQNGKIHHIGRHDTPEQAAHAYNLFVLTLPTAEYEYLNEISIYAEVD